MEPGRGRVVGDLDLGADAGERFAGAELCAAGVRRGDDADLLAAVDEAAHRLDQVADACPADEGEDDVDAVGRLDLCGDLVADRRLVAAVGHEDGVAQRRHRPADGDGLARRREPLDGDEPLDRVDQHLLGAEQAGAGRGKARQHGTDNSDCFLGSIVVRDRSEGELRPPADDLADAVGDFRWVDLLERRPQGAGVEGEELGVEQLIDEAVVKTGQQLRHACHHSRAIRTDPEMMSWFNRHLANEPSFELTRRLTLKFDIEGRWFHHPRARAARSTAHVHHPRHLGFRTFLTSGQSHCPREPLDEAH